MLVLLQCRVIGNPRDSLSRLCRFESYRCIVPLSPLEQHISTSAASRATVLAAVVSGLEFVPTRREEDGGDGRCGLPSKQRIRPRLMLESGENSGALLHGSSPWTSARFGHKGLVEQNRSTGTVERVLPKYGLCHSDCRDVKNKRRFMESYGRAGSSIRAYWVCAAGYRNRSRGENKCSSTR